MWSVDSCKNIIGRWGQKTIYNPDLERVDSGLLSIITHDFKADYERYYPDQSVNLNDIKYFPGLLATFFYRISRFLFLSGDEEQAQEYSSVGFALSSMEIYFSASIKSGLKINHGLGTVIGARVEIGKNALIHQNVTFGDKNGGRPKVGDEVTIYPGSIIIGDVNIGDRSIIGANTIVLKSVPSDSRVSGVFK